VSNIAISNVNASSDISTTDAALAHGKGNYHLFSFPDAQQFDLFRMSAWNNHFGHPK